MGGRVTANVRLGHSATHLSCQGHQRQQFHDAVPSTFRILSHTPFLSYPSSFPSLLSLLPLAPSPSLLPPSSTSFSLPQSPSLPSVSALPLFFLSFHYHPQSPSHPLLLFAFSFTSIPSSSPSFPISPPTFLHLTFASSITLLSFSLCLTPFSFLSYLPHLSSYSPALLPL